MKFLVVDDSATMRRIIINSLRRIGYSDCLEASEGGEALERCDASIDFVITDWNMPGMSGLDFAESLRSRSESKHIPILMITTRNAREDILAAVEAGVNNYIIKPFTPQLLKEKINQILSTTPALR